MGVALPEASSLQSRSPIFLVIVLLLTGLSIWGYLTKDYAYGLDVRGGVRLTYQIDPESLTEETSKRLPTIQEDLVRIMTLRSTSAVGVVEASVAKKGSDQVVVELPGFTDITKAQETLGTTAKIQVYHARNVSTPLRQRFYEPVEDRTGGVPVVNFTRRSNPSEVLKPGSEGYKRMLEGWTVILEGGEVSDALPIMQGTNVVPQFRFNAEGARKMEQWTRRFKQENLAFVLDGKVLSISPVKENTILTDNAFIDGTFPPDYVNSLTKLIKAGALPVGLLELSSLKVDPTIGMGALDAIRLAGFISFGLVIVFLVVYYGFPGVVASLAMCLYAVFTITVLKWLNATFSLAAITALILSISMAVDANILIFERLKEEVREGRTLLTAIQLAFKRALSAIVDSNAATIGTSIVLFVLGTGPVKGFATTLIVGVAISFFTAVFVTRLIIEGLTGVGIGTNPKWYALNRSWFGEKLEQSAEQKPLNIIQKSNLYFGISAALVLVGMIFVGIGGIKPNVEFQGGFEGVYQIPAGQNLSSSELVTRLKAGGIETANVKFGEGRDVETKQPVRLAYITVPYNAGIEAGDNQALSKVAEAAGLPTTGGSFQEVGGTIQRETVSNAILGTAISAALIIVWLAIRFGIALGGLKNGLKFGISAVLAMLHDVAFVIGVAAIVGIALGWEVSALFITAMLTVASFSVHDTIVIFDRIRENLRKPHKGQTFEFLVNKSITQTIGRSINTSMTAIVTLLILIAIGTPTPDLKFMCVTMVAGLVVGTYSSIFNASPILYLWDKMTIKKKGESAGLMADAEREIKLRASAAQLANAPADASYGSVKRRSSVVDKATKPLDE